MLDTSAKAMRVGTSLLARCRGKGDRVRLITLPGVFKPISDSYMLAEVLRNQTLAPGHRVLDLCTGSGLLALTAALRGVEHVTAVDVSFRSLANVQINARLNGTRVRTLRGSLFEPVGSERFDLIVSNPPYVPAETDELQRTVNYAELAQRLHSVLSGEPVDLLETLAQRLADVCLAYQLVDAVEVTVHKPEADLGVPFGDVTVTIRRERRG